MQLLVLSIQGSIPSRPTKNVLQVQMNTDVAKDYFLAKNSKRKNKKNRSIAVKRLSFQRRGFFLNQYLYPEYKSGEI
jgi:hypothetical protein